MKESATEGKVRKNLRWRHELLRLAATIYVSTKPIIFALQSNAGPLEER